MTWKEWRHGIRKEDKWMKEEIARLRKALEYYADDNNPIYGNAGIEDGFKVAREALKKGTP